MVDLQQSQQHYRKGREGRNGKSKDREKQFLKIITSLKFFDHRCKGLYFELAFPWRPSRPWRFSF
jgi:hypothetical protein